MEELLNRWIPNVMDKTDVFYTSINETLEMVIKSGFISFVIGLFLGVLITVTKKGGILQNMFIYQVIDKLVNFFRSIPFIVLLASLVPLTRMISGTAIGVDGAIVPLVFGCVSFFTRQIESALADVSDGLIEAAKSMGLSKIDIIIRVYLKESVAGISRATTITLINLVGLTAMAGAIGAGGLGDFAIRFGHQRNQPDVTYTTVLVLVLFVSIIQIIGNVIAKRNTH